MKLRRAKPEEFEKVRNFYWDLIDEMTGKPNTVLWKKGIYPSDDFLKNSIDGGELYVLDGEKGYSASVILNSAWNEGYNGCPWSLDCDASDVLVPHALAVKPALQNQGVGKLVVQDIFEMAKATGKKTVRLDILKDNISAKRLYIGMGFQYVASKTMFYEDTGWTEFMMFERIL